MSLKQILAALLRPSGPKASYVTPKQLSNVMAAVSDEIENIKLQGGDTVIIEAPVKISPFKHWVLVNGRTDRNKGLQNIVNSGLSFGNAAGADSVVGDGYQIIGDPLVAKYFRTPIPLYDLYKNRTFLIAFNVFIPSDYNPDDTLNKNYLFGDLYSTGPGMALRVMKSGVWTFQMRVDENVTAGFNFTASGANVMKLGQWNEILITIDSITGDYVVLRQDAPPWWSYSPYIGKALSPHLRVTDSPNRMLLGYSLFTPTPSAWSHSVKYLAISTSSMPLANIDLNELFSNLLNNKRFGVQTNVN